MTEIKMVRERLENEGSFIFKDGAGDLFFAEYFDFPEAAINVTPIKNNGLLDCDNLEMVFSDPEIEDEDESVDSVMDEFILCSGLSEIVGSADFIALAPEHLTKQGPYIVYKPMLKDFDEVELMENVGKLQSLLKFAFNNEYLSIDPLRTEQINSVTFATFEITESELLEECENLGSSVYMLSEDLNPAVKNVNKSYSTLCYSIYAKLGLHDDSMDFSKSRKLKEEIENLIVEIGKGIESFNQSLENGKFNFKPGKPESLKNEIEKMN